MSEYIPPLFDAEKGTAGPPVDNQARLTIPESPAHRVDELLAGLMDEANPRIFTAQDLEQHREGLRLQMEAVGFSINELSTSPENRLALQSDDLLRLQTNRGRALFVAFDGPQAPDTLTSHQQSGDLSQIAAYLDSCHLTRFRRWAQVESQGQPALKDKPPFTKRKGAEHLAVIMLGFAAGEITAPQVREEILWRVGRKKEKPIMDKLKKLNNQSQDYQNLKTQLDLVRGTYEIPPVSDEPNRDRYKLKASTIPTSILPHFTQSLVSLRRMSPEQFLEILPQAAAIPSDVAHGWDQFLPKQEKTDHDSDSSE